MLPTLYPQRTPFRLPGLILSALCIAAALTGGASALSDPDENATAEKAALSVDDPVFDWGSVYQGEKIDHTFTLSNKSDKAFTIKEVKLNCGCLVAMGEVKEKRLDPGKSMPVAIRVDTTKLKSGPLTKTATIKTDVLPSGYNLVLKGEVKEALRAEPRAISLVLIRDENVPVKPLQIKLHPNLKEGPTRLKKVRLEKGLVAAVLKKTKPGNPFMVEIRPWSISRYKNNVRSDTLLVEVSVEGKDLVQSFPISIILKDRIQVLPSKSFFFSRRVTKKLKMPGAPPPTKILNIKSAGSPAHTFRIKKITTNDKHFRVKVETVKAGKHYRLRVEMLPLPADFKGRTLRGTILIETDDPLVPRLKLPGIAQV